MRSKRWAWLAAVLCAGCVGGGTGDTSSSGGASSTSSGGASSTSSGGTGGTTGTGSRPVCADCARDGDCASGYCNVTAPAPYCDVRGCRAGSGDACGPTTTCYGGTCLCPPETQAPQPLCAACTRGPDCQSGRCTLTADGGGYCDGFDCAAFAGACGASVCDTANDTCICPIDTDRNLPVCASCRASAECASRYCNATRGAPFCDVAACDGVHDACKPTTICDVNQGSCVCPAQAAGAPICAACTDGADCASGYCNTLAATPFCDSAAPCTQHPTCGPITTCEPSTDSCLCPAGAARTPCASSADCAAAEVCTSTGCVPALQAAYTVGLELTIAATRPDGTCWDCGTVVSSPSPPDPYANLSASGPPAQSLASFPVESDTFAGSWSSTGLRFTRMVGNYAGGTLSIDVRDSDSLGTTSPICAASLGPASTSSTLHAGTWSGGATESCETLGMTFAPR